MCDDHSEAENATWLTAQQQLNRRQFGIAGASAAALTLLPGYAVAASATAKGLATKSSIVKIPTSDGTADAFFVHPTTGKHPAIILWPDIAGLRDAFEKMATRLAAAGYAVIAVNQYYRSAPAPVLENFAQWRTDEGQAKLKPMVAAINPAATTSDAGAFVDWLDKQPQVDTKRKIGNCGYCMGGPFTIRTAFARPERVGAAASFHGGNLVNDSADSPHKLFAATKAAMLFAIAQNDDARSPEVKGALKVAAEAAKRAAEIEVYPAQHGWCVIDSPVYDEVQAEKAWSRMLALYEKNL